MRLARPTWVLAGVVLLLVGIAGVRRWCAPRARFVTLPAAEMRGEPRAMLWAWETPEDLRSLDVRDAGVAFLAREVELTPAVAVRPRRQPLLLPAGAWLMADVRVEVHLRAGERLQDSPELRAEVVRAVLPAASLPGVRALQVDFDATASQLEFYRGVLEELRRAMPPWMPLSITALPSWCGVGGFLEQLGAGPSVADEAVAMEFRLGGPVGSRLRAKSMAGVVAPLCRTAVGVATDETWPEFGSTERVYVFRDGPWTAKELSALHRGGILSLRRH